MANVQISLNSFHRFVQISSKYRFEHTACTYNFFNLENFDIYDMHDDKVEINTTISNTTI